MSDGNHGKWNLRLSIVRHATSDPSLSLGFVPHHPPPATFQMALRPRRMSHSTFVCLRSDRPLYSSSLALPSFNINPASTGRPYSQARLRDRLHPSRVHSSLQPDNHLPRISRAPSTSHPYATMAVNGARPDHKRVNTWQNPGAAAHDFRSMKIPRPAIPTSPGHV